MSWLALICIACLYSVAAGIRVAHPGSRQTRSEQSSPESGYDCSRHDVLNDLVVKDVARLWGKSTLTAEAVQSISQTCSYGITRIDYGLNLTPHCYTLSVLIENGVPFITSKLPGTHPIEWIMHVGFLLDILDTTLAYGPQLPNVEFMLDMGDQPLVTGPVGLRGRPKARPDAQSSGKSSLMPMIMQFRRDAHPVLLAPTPHVRCFVNTMDEIQANLTAGEYDRVPWEQRKQVAIARYSVFCPNQYIQELNLPANRDSRVCGRKAVLEASAAQPDIIDAKDSNAFVGGRKQFLPLINHTQYRYIINTDGWAASTRLEKLLPLGSTVVKEDSPWYAYYYPAMAPNVHYVPFNASDPGDLARVVSALKANDTHARAVATAAREFAASHLTRPARLCYWRALIIELGKLFDHKPTCQGRPTCVPVAKVLAQLSSPVDGTGHCKVAEQLRAMGVRVAPATVNDRLGDITQR